MEQQAPDLWDPVNALSAQQLAQQVAATLKCGVCHKLGHTETYCISEGGGMEGKTIEELKRKRKMDREAQRKTKGMAMASASANSGSSTSRIRIPYKDSNGQVLILELDPSAITATLAPTGQSSTFAGLASLCTDDLAYSTEALELGGWMVTYDVMDLPETHLSAIPVNPKDFAFTMVLQAYVGFRKLDVIPFKMDSGASMAISPVWDDFVNYRPILPHGVHGLGGVIVNAVGIGNIVIHLSKNWSLILHNALHIPKATVCLISISALWHYAGKRFTSMGRLALLHPDMVSSPPSAKPEK
ncbi:hypothetical protein CPB84DRAFT_1849511 [Gymnopilus junonius]|uniref:Retrovirus-related Pol polyprotein from transposon TNT 1-94-like beta-barrel domain-containing protein n=1 Tax=Gymnopilus junonius TaxID=109634 RepID=A0A9P5TKY5_GYMJU|nr:hypothetical protein CPB84DRAFT_1849511 [Gymnopilus junonius]